MAYLTAIWVIIEAMAPYLLLGLLLAGVMHVFLPKDFIYKKLSQPGMGTVFKASLLGVPMPLCSCSVIPVAQHLHKSGASRGSTLSFVASTPSTGLDSITALWGLLGPVYTLFKVVLAFFSGWLVGFLNLEERVEAVYGGVEGESSDPAVIGSANVSAMSSATSFGGSTLGSTGDLSDLKAADSIQGGFFASAKEAIVYAFDDLFKDFAKWLLIGTLLGASLEFIIPQDLGLMDEMAWSYLFVIIVSMPLYVCATGSIPIALGLLAQGFSPGAALLFLTLGPITNAATITWLWGTFGAKVTSLYFTGIALLALAGAWVMDSFFRETVISQAMSHQHEESSLFTLVISVLFCAVWLYHLVNQFSRWMSKKFEPAQEVLSGEDRIEVPISGMTCGNCQAKVESILSEQDINAQVNLEKNVLVLSDSELEKLRSASMLLAMKGYPILMDDL